MQRMVLTDSRRSLEIFEREEKSGYLITQRQQES